MFTAFGHLKQRTHRISIRARQRASTEQITWIKLAAVDGMMSYHLSERPIHVASVAQAQPRRRYTLLSHRWSKDEHLKGNIERASALIFNIQQIRKRTRITRGPCRLSAAERFQRFWRHDPW
ncbi:hypothetical protein D3C81_1524480 [compost metagenome]